ncbi:MAG: UbiD family decarboxylase [Chloroflexi bacterium]|nr:UbiD family decarboxylase [Chloroflexota bacterium]
MNKNLRDFIQAAKELGPEHYVAVKKPLSPYLEPGIIQQKLAAEGRYPVIFCPTIEGSKLPLVTNLFGSFETLALGVGCDPRRMTRDEVYDVVRKKMATKLAPKWVPASEAPVKQVKFLEEQVDLGILPISHNSKLDAGKYVGAGFMIAKWPDTGVPNAGVYRHLVMGKDRLGCMINPGNDGAYIARRHAELDQLMQVALVIGHHAGVVQASLARQVVELELMGGFLGEPLEVTRGETVDLPIPAQAEIVIEGIIDPKNMATDGPYAEYLGYYGVANKPCYVIQVTAITMRKDAIYHHLDSSQREHTWSGSLISQVAMYDKLKAQFPTLKAVNIRGWLGTYVSLRQRVAGEGRQAALVAVTDNYGKTVVAVDDDIDVFNEQEVMWAISTRMVADEDLLILPGVKGAHLDPVSYGESRPHRGPMTTHLVIDATRPVEHEFEVKIEPDEHLWKRMKLEDYLK